MSFLDMFKKSASNYALYNSVGREVSYRHDKLGYLTLNEKTLYVNRGLQKRGEKIGQTEWIIKKGDKTVENDKFLELLNRPNTQMSGHTFWKMTSMYRDTTGEAWIRKIGNGAVFKDNRSISELKLLNTSRVQKIFNKSKDEIISVKYTNYDGSVETIPFEELIYWHRPSLVNPLEGESLLMAGLRSIQTENQLIELQNKIAYNGGKLDGVFRFKNENLTKNQIKELKESFKESLHQAKEDTDNILFVGGGGEYQNIALNPTEIGYLESRKLFADDMVVITGVPRVLLGLTSGETFANADAAIRIFLREVIKPDVEDLTNLLNYDLVPKDLDLIFVDPTPEDTENKLKIVSTGETSNTLTVNERRELLGYDPIKNGDDVLVGFAKLPLGEPMSAPVEKKKTKEALIDPLQDVTARRAYHKNYLKSLESNTAILEKAVVTYFNGQEKRILERLQVSKTKGLFDELWNERLEIDLAKLGLLPIIKQLAIEAGQETMEIFNGNPFNYSTELDIQINKRVEFFAKKINQTVASQLGSVFTDWSAGERPLTELVADIETAYDGIKTVNARRIANTETGILMQSTKMSAYTQMNRAVKIWTWSPGLKGGVRDDHIILDGEMVGLNERFSNGMMHPLDSSASAGDIINCECSI